MNVIDTISERDNKLVIKLVDLWNRYQTGSDEFKEIASKIMAEGDLNVLVALLAEAYDEGYDSAIEDSLDSERR